MSINKLMIMMMRMMMMRGDAECCIGGWEIIGETRNCLKVGKEEEEEKKDFWLQLLPEIMAKMNDDRFITI